MILLLVSIISMISFSAIGYQVIDISPLQQQLRFEDTSAQSKENVAYQSYSAAYQQDIFRLGVNYARKTDETGNASLRIETEKKDYLANLGYQVFYLQGKSNRLRLDIFAEGVVGFTQAQVTTLLIGSSTSSVSNNDLVYGLGAAAVGRFYYFFLETNFQMLGSTAFAPQYVPVATLKAGFSIPFL